MKLQINPWYETLGFSTNPFTIKPNTRFKVYGRQNAKDAVVSTVQNNGVVVVEGIYGSGKTTFLRSIIRPFGGKKKVVYFACNRLHTDLDVDRLLYERFGIFTKMFRIKSKQMILLLDEADNLSKKDFATIQKYYSGEYLQSVVFVSHKPLKLPAFFKNKAVFVHFEDMQIESVIEMVRERIGDSQLLTDEVIEALFQKDKRIRFFLKNCELFMKYMVEQNRTSAKPKDVDTALMLALNVE